MTKDEFWKLFTIVTIISNAISILISGIEHWTSSFFSGYMLILNLIGLVTSFLLTSESVNWQYVLESMNYAFSFWGVTIISFLLTISIIAFKEYRV